MADLELRKLGRTGLNVTVLGFGAMELRAPGSAIRSGRPVDPAQAGKVLNAALDGGINFIDTSIDYGRSEDSIGESISHRRHEYYLATKCGCNADLEAIASGTARGHTFSRDNIREGVHLSLRRMKTDYLDLVQFHGPPPVETRDEAIQAMLELKREGKTRFIGVSAVLPEVAGLVETGAFDTVQVPYSALEREHEAFIGQAALEGLGVVGRGRHRPGRARSRTGRAVPVAEVGRSRTGGIVGGNGTGSNSCCGTPSATRACTPRLSAPWPRTTWPAIWTPPPRAPCRHRCATRWPGGWTPPLPPSSNGCSGSTSGVRKR